MTNKPCSEHYVLEPQKGVLQYCPHNEHAEWVQEGLRAIASLRSTTTVLIKNVCENHKDPVTKWNEAMERVQQERDAKIIQFTKKQ